MLLVNMDKEYQPVLTLLPVLAAFVQFNNPALSNATTTSTSTGRMQFRDHAACMLFYLGATERL